MSQAFDTQYQSAIVCPHCGTRYSEPWEISGDHYDCDECGKRFGIERDTDVSYSTHPADTEEEAMQKRKRQIEAERASLGPEDRSFEAGPPTPEPRVGTIGVYQTSLSVWEDEVLDRLRATTFQTMLARLHARGFTLQRDPRILRDHPVLADDHWYGRRGDLEVEVEVSGRHAKAEFFQNLNIENPNGGRYDFDKFKRMPRTMQLECVTELTGLYRALGGYGYRPCERHALSAGLPLPLAIRDRVVEKRTTDPLAYFNESWSSHRPKRDETGFIAESEYLLECWGGGRDRDGVRMRTGDTRYFYEGGRLMRATVFPSFNGQWIVAFRGEVTCRQVNELFLCDPDATPRRFVKGQRERLHRELEKATKAKAYGRVAALGSVLARETAP